MSLSLLNQLNYVAILVAAILYFVVGALWYSPLLFGKQWMAAVGFTDEDVQGGSAVIYLYPLLFYVIAAIVMALLVSALQITNVAEGIFLAGLGWLGFLLPSMGASMVFESRPTKLFLIYSGYHLVGFLILGIILTVWQ